MGTNFGGVHVGCHCWVPLGAIAGVPLLGASAGCHCWGVPLLDASYQLRRSSRWVVLILPIGGGLATNFGGVHVGCHCWVPLGAIAGVPLLGASAGCHCWVPLGAIAGCHCWGVPLLDASYQLRRSSRWVVLILPIGGGVGYQLWRGSRWVPLLGAIGCHCWVPPCRGAAGCHCSVPLLGCHCWGAIAGCHGGVPWLDALPSLAEFTLGAIAGCHAGVPLLDAIAPFSAAPFSRLITHKLACAIWGLCWYNLELLIHPSF